MANNLALTRLKSQAQHSDLNKDFGSPGNADMLFDKDAIRQSLYNIFYTYTGEAGPIFLPTFGSGLPELLHEPMDARTAFAIRSASIQAAERWEERIDVDAGNCQVAVDYTLPGYRVILAYTIRKTGEAASSDIPISLFTAGGETLVLPDTVPTNWNPTALTQLDAWYDGADSKSVTQSISRLTKWKDKSGKGNTLTPLLIASNTNPFALVPGAINGLNSVRVANGTSPNTLRFTTPITFGANFHLFLVVRNDALALNNGDSFGFNLLTRPTNDPLAATLRVNYGIDGTLKLPALSAKHPDVPTDAYIGNIGEMGANLPTFLELRVVNNLAYFIVNRSVRLITPFSQVGVPMIDLLTAFGSLPSNHSLYVGEVIVCTDYVTDSDVELTRNYLYSKWLNTSITTPPEVVGPAVLSDISITAAYVPQTSPDRRDIKLIIRHTRTSKPQSIQYKLVVSGPGKPLVTKIREGTIKRYTGPDLVDDNPVVSSHNFVPYSDAELIGPWSYDTIWTELLATGLIFTSVEDTNGRTEITMSFPTGTDLAYPGIAFDLLTFSIVALGSGLTDPASVTVTLAPLQPNVSFSADVISGIAPLSVNFSDTSSGPAQQWRWSFTDAGTEDSLDQNPTHVYTDPGIYSVTLLASNTTGTGTLTRTNYIEVLDPNLDGDPYLQWVALLLHAEEIEGSQTFVDSSRLQCTTTANGTAHATTTVKKFGAGGMDLVGADAWTSSSGAYFEFNDFTYETWVLAPSISYDRHTPLLSLKGGNDLWLGVNSLNSCLSLGIESYLQQGTQIFIPGIWNHVAYVRHNGYLMAWLNGRLSDTLIDSRVFELEHPLVGRRADAYTPLSGCYFDEVRLTLDKARYLAPFNVPTGPFPDGNALPPIPQVNIQATPQLGQAPLTVNFADLSTGNPTAWEWDFTNAGVVNSREKNPSYTYPAAGTYSVKLKVSNATGSTTQVFTNYITAGNPPVTNFTFAPPAGNSPLSVSFTDTSTG